MNNTIKTPLFPEQELVDWIRQFTNLSSSELTLNDIQKPTYEKMYVVYSCLLCKLLKSSHEQNTQLPLSVLETITLQDCCIDSAAGNLLLMKMLKYALHICAVDDFSENDLLSPSRKRTRKHLSAICNFLHYYDNLSILNSITDQVKNHSVKVTSLQNEKAVLKQRISVLKGKKKEDHIAIQEINLAALKAKHQEVASVKVDYAGSVEEKKREVEEIQNFLILAKASKSISQAKAALEERVLRKKNLSVKEKMMENLIENVPSFLTMIQEVQTDMAQCKSILSAIEEMKEKSDRINYKIQEINADMESCKRLISLNQESNMRAEARKMKLQEDFMNRKAIQEKKLENIVSKMEKKQAQINIVKADVQNEIDKEIVEETDHQNIIKQLKAKKESLELMWDQYLNKVMLKVEEQNKKLLILASFF
ncbi:kinetochore protein Nuf2 isoform X1 [Hydra vulgaris]|uniref:kinetochore protein Nuf2 isoform X1 n=1 Tax=Hydra vulgaris TaxID=6087 RepID=UPI0032EA4B53